MQATAEWIKRLGICAPVDVDQRQINPQLGEAHRKTGEIRSRLRGNTKGLRTGQCQLSLRAKVARYDCLWAGLFGNEIRRLILSLHFAS